MSVSDKILELIIFFFHLVGMSLFKIVYRKIGNWSVNPSKSAIFVSIFTFCLMFYCIIINFNGDIPGAQSFLPNSGSTKTISMFLRLLSHSKVLVVFIPLWLFFRHGQLIYVRFLQVNDILCGINEKLTPTTISTPTVKKTCTLIFFMAIYGVLQLTYVFAKAPRLDESWMTWSMIICTVSPNVYAIFCIVHLFLSLTLLSERIKQVKRILKEMFK